MLLDKTSLTTKKKLHILLERFLTNIYLFFDGLGP